MAMALARSGACTVTATHRPYQRCVPAAALRPARLRNSSSSSSSRLTLCRAEPADGSQPAAAATTQEQPQQPQQAAQPPPPQQQEEQAPVPTAPLLAPGQGTAIVTGAISIIFGIAYLVLVSLLDSRGGDMQPPPPEAFM